MDAGSDSGSDGGQSKARRRSSIYETRIAGLYDLEKTIGKGHYAVVKLARHVFTGEKVAVKVIDKSALEANTQAALMQEVRCMKLVQHPNIVRLYEVIDTSSKLFLVLELADLDLYEYLFRQPDKGLPEPKAQAFFAQIVEAIHFCHQLHVVHRDLKLENFVYLEELEMVKLTDFGFSNRFVPGETLDTSCGSLAYSAPEILLGDAYDAPAVDVWSLGVILFMLLSGGLPFHEANDSETLTKIMDCSFRIPASVSQPAADLIRRLLVREPTARPTLKEIADVPWVKAGQRGHAHLLPLISRRQVSEEQHQFIISNMVQGSVADSETIHSALEKDEYSSVTATYFLLAEQLLKRERIDEARKALAASNAEAAEEAAEVVCPGCSDAACASCGQDASVPSSSRRNSWRARICSMVKEESEEELDSYVRSPGPTRRPRPTSTTSSASPSVSAHNLPAAIVELQELIAAAPLLPSRPRTPPERLSSRSPSPASGRTSPAPRFKTPVAPSLRKLASSPHLRGICEEGEDAPDGAARVHPKPAQTYSSVRMIRPRHAVVSPDVIRRYERVYGKSSKSRRSTSCSSSEASDEDATSHFLLSRYCGRDGSDRDDDAEPPLGGAPSSKRPPHPGALRLSSGSAKGGGGTATGPTAAQSVAHHKSVVLAPISEVPGHPPEARRRRLKARRCRPPQLCPPLRPLPPPIRT